LTAAKKTKQKIIHLLKQEGEMDALDLASILHISGMAARQHLYALQEEGLVTYQEETRKMGRPAKMWRLTSQADDFFPNGYAKLTLSLMSTMADIFGKEGLNQLLETRNHALIESYLEKMEENPSLPEKLQRLAEIRTEEGYMAEIRPEEDAYLLIEKHCPICAVSAVCEGFCSKEKELFQAVLGNQVQIKRIDHILDGKTRCTYQIKEKQR